MSRRSGASSNRCSIAEMAYYITQALNEYEKFTTEDVKKVVRKTANEAVKELRQASPKRSNGGGYAGAWTKQKSPDVKDSSGELQILYNPISGLPHLLEHGHALTRGGRKIGQGSVKAYPHIKPVEERAKQRLEERIKEVI